MDQFGVVVSAGSFQDTGEGAVRFPHRWTEAGVTVRADFTGAHLLHLSAAGCVLNDLYREAAGLGIHLSGVRVTAAGAFDTTTWTSTGIAYTVELDSPGDDGVLTGLLARVDEIAEIPRAIRAGAPVIRKPSNGASNAGPL
ncbi:OsmC family protein [Actinoplanes sp. CA-015351]|uniref:OsmC family protein n=1 Tax=Actinoplanes sp. CA-015351 TaxID=3239897 RepID=UPI003D9995BC